MLTRPNPELYYFIMKSGGISAWTKPILIIVFIWVGILSFWFTNNITNKDNFSRNIVGVFKTEELRNALASDVVGEIEENFPLIGRIAGPTLSKVFVGVLDSDLVDRVYHYVAEAMHRQMMTADSQGVSIDVKNTVDFILPILASQNPELAERIERLPFEIVILPDGRLPNISLTANILENFGQPLGLVGLGLLIYAMWKSPSLDSRRILGHRLAIILALTSAIIYILLGTIESFMIAQGTAEVERVFTKKLFESFTTNISQAALILTFVGLLTAILTHFLARKTKAS